MSAIQVQGLRKEYGSKVAVDGVSFEVERGEIFGFLGPNGAGKTTTIKILTTLIPASAGVATVLGFDVRKDGMNVRKRIGVVQQQPSGEYNLGIAEQMELYGLVWDVPKPVRKQRVENLLDAFGLQSHRRERWSELSIGLRRRVQVAREFMHDMDLLFLDEPTVGLDPIARRSTLDMIKGRVSEGLTVFFTTHILDEAEYLCDRVAIVNNGKIVAVDTPKKMKERFGGLQTVEALVEGGDSSALVRELRGLDGVSEVDEEDGGLIKVLTSNPSEALRLIGTLTEKTGARIIQLNLREPTLEQAFVSLVTTKE